MTLNEHLDRADAATRAAWEAIEGPFTLKDTRSQLFLAYASIALEHQEAMTLLIRHGLWVCCCSDSPYLRDFLPRCMDSSLRQAQSDRKDQEGEVPVSGDGSNGQRHRQGHGGDVLPELQGKQLERPKRLSLTADACRLIHD